MAEKEKLALVCPECGLTLTNEAISNLKGLMFMIVMEGVCPNCVLNKICTDMPALEPQTIGATND